VDLVTMTLTDTPVGIRIPCCGEMHTVSWTPDGQMHLQHHPEHSEEDRHINEAFRKMGPSAPGCFKVEANVWTNIEKYDLPISKTNPMSIHCVYFWTDECALLEGTKYIRKGAGYDEFLSSG